MKTIEISREAAVKALRQARAGDDLPTTLATLLGPEAVKDTLPVTERITTIDEIIAWKGANDPLWQGVAREEFDKVCAAGRMTPDEIGHRLFKWGCEAYNEGWKPDYSNSSEPKHTIWMEYKKGSGFSFYDSVIDYRSSTVGSRLVFRTGGLAQAFAAHFTPLINQAFS